jgi:glycosyltransferase involved in cell wall biosynthesis
MSNVMTASSWEAPLADAGHRPRRVAVVVSDHAHAWEYGQTLRITDAVIRGAAAAGTSVEIVLATAGAMADPPPEIFRSLPQGVRHRHIRWRLLDAGESRRALAYAGQPECAAGVHLVPDDGIRHMLDCDTWLVTAAGLSAPVLPLRPVVLMLEDWMHHAICGPGDIDPASLVKAVGLAAGVVVFSEWMRDEAVHFLGADPRRVVRLPIPTPPVAVDRGAGRGANARRHFIWCVDGRHPGNVASAVRCLEQYCGAPSPPLPCRIVPLRTDTDGEPWLPEAVRSVTKNPACRAMVDCASRAADDPDRLAAELREAAFLWHPEQAVDSRYILAEAATCGVPCLAADAPSIREVTAALGLDVAWAQLHHHAAMVRALRAMPEWVGRDVVAAESHAGEDSAADYWAALAVHA